MSSEPDQSATSTHQVRFFILSGARTGSNMLASALNSNSEIACFRELFNTTVDSVLFHMEGYDNNNKEDRELRDSDFAAFLETRIFIARDGVVAVGFKLPYTHFLGFPGLGEWLIHKKFRVLHLRRRNLLRMFVSNKIALATGAWVDGDREPLASKIRPAVLLRAVRNPARYAKRAISLLRRKPPAWKAQRPRLTLSQQECTDFFLKITLQAGRYDGLFSELDMHTLYYEDLVEDQKTTLDAAQAFLGVSPQTLRISTGRQNPEPLGDLIADYETLRDAFRGTDHEAFFD